MKLAFVGDIMLGDSTSTVGIGVHSRYPGLLVVHAMNELRDAMQGTALRLGNLECVLTESGLGSNRQARDQMRALPAVARALRDLGFNALSVANNHAMQHGRRAFDETVGHLHDAGIRPVGLRGSKPWTAQPEILELEGRRIGILGYCLRPRQYDYDVPPFAEGDTDAICMDVARLRPSCDRVVVCLHWGDEFVSEPSEADVLSARRIIGSGADVVVGHHPHVTQPVVADDAGVVAYSLGNAISDMLWMDDLRRGQCLIVDADSPRNTRLLSLWTTDNYRVSVSGEEAFLTSHPAGLSETEYENRVRSGLSKQRRHLYAYTLRHLHTLPLPVAASMILTTARNKVLSAFGH